MADRSTPGRRNHLRSAVAVNDGDLEEEDVWSTLNNTDDTGELSRTTTARPIPRSSSHQHHYEARPARQSSVPVSIPDWSKVYGKGKVMTSSIDRNEEDDEEEEEEEGGMVVPPHEWIARKLARSQISSSSMCEGLGRTLKGRDLSKVRNAILSKTGFLE